MGRPGATQPHGFQRPTASSLGNSGPTSSGSSSSSSSGQRGPTTAAELLAPWQERQGIGLDDTLQDHDHDHDHDSAPAAAAGEFVGQIYEHTRHLVQWSPDGRWLAAAQGRRVTVRDPGSMQIEAHFSCAAEVEYMEWAPDSDGLLCAAYKKQGSVQAFRVNDPHWACTLSEGQSGVSLARWAPDARHVLTMTDFGLALTVWPILTGTDPSQTLVIRRPKPDVAPAFSPDGSVMAVASRLDARDHVALYATGAGRWRPLRTFPLDTVDVAALHWAPDGGSLVVQDTSLVYSIAAFAPDGHACLGSYQAYEGNLGIKSVAFSPQGSYLALGSYDQRLRLLNTLTWEVAFDGGMHQAPSTDHDRGPQAPQAAPQCTGDFIGYTEAAPGAGFSPGLPPTLPYVKPDTGKANPKLGVGLLLWSDDGCFLLSRNDSMPHALFIWDVEARGLAAVLLFADPVRTARWGPQRPSVHPNAYYHHHNDNNTSLPFAAGASGSDHQHQHHPIDDDNDGSPRPPQLCVATGGPRFYLWSPSTVPGTPPAAPTWFDIPVADGAFDVTRLRWAPLPPPKRRWGGADETPGSKTKGMSVLRLAQGDGGEEGEGGEEEGEGEGVAMLVALMSAEHWCVCALDR